MVLGVKLPSWRGEVASLPPCIIPTEVALTIRSTELAILLTELGSLLMAVTFAEGKSIALASAWANTYQGRTS